MVPDCLKFKLINEIHERIGHLGIGKTIREIQNTFWWFGMRADIKKKVSCCDLCQRVKSLNYGMGRKFLPVIAEKPNDLVAVDYFGPIPASRVGVEYIFVVLDVFSRYVKLYPLKRATARASITKLVKYFNEVGNLSGYYAITEPSTNLKSGQDF